ncbi:hypothetical protein GCM10028857_02930 [Salinarchaeum chitinilyticum]
MRYKTVPPAPPDERDAIASLETVREALPPVPRSEADCCARLVERVEWIGSRDVASEWIAFLHALGLAERTDSGYARARGDEIPTNPDRDELDRESLASRFRDGILGAAEVCDALERNDGLEPNGDRPSDAAPDPLTVDEAFDALEPVVPEWERRRSDAWRATWQEHAERRLVWATMLGLAEESEGGYVRA